jgi:beta-aspartyl-dipeptidase (metallo-type)
MPPYGEGIEVYDAAGCFVVPGFIDQHVHLIGGGGEGGFATRTPEVMLSQLTTAGITTVVGTLGTDSVTRHL